MHQINTIDNFKTSDAADRPLARFNTYSGLADWPGFCPLCITVIYELTTKTQSPIVSTVRGKQVDGDTLGYFQICVLLSRAEDVVQLRLDFPSQDHTKVKNSRNIVPKIWNDASKASFLGI